MTQSWHEEELVSFAWRCTTSAHADEIISNRHDHAMAFAIERMDANLQRILSYVRFFHYTPKFRDWPMESGSLYNSASPKV